MSRLYGMQVEIKNFVSGKSTAIQIAANKQWCSFADNWDEIKNTGEWGKQVNTLYAYGEGNLHAGETESSFTSRLTRAIWTANGAFCEVTVNATCLEDLPHETRTPSEKDYDIFIAESGAPTATTPPTDD